MRKPKWIKCPSCKGGGACLGIKGTKCRWCNGVKKVGKEKALEYAAMTECFAFGSYIEGGTLEELRADESESKKIREHFNP
jgi:hypothetical protein